MTAPATADTAHPAAPKARVAFCYPPIPSEKGTPLLSQNRQFQWFSRPSTIYPVVPASAATLLKTKGYAVLWLDGIARNTSPEAYWADLIAWQPDVVFLETKTPVVRFHWKWAAELKRRLPDCRLVMAGDHVTALPEETLNAAPVDAVLKGGDYDFALLSWLEQREIPVDLSQLPPIDRTLTHWQDYAYRNGNFAKTPGAYIMSARDCWHGKCTFCSWTTLYPVYRVRPVAHVLDEIGALIKLGVREIMDDAGCLPVGQWLTDFCHGMIQRGYHRKVRLDCNLRFGAVPVETYRLMRKAGFRLVLFGVESANQSTLDKLNKNLTLAQIHDGAKAASAAGLDVHITLMFGYPWETAQEAARTVRLGRAFLRTGLAATLQATWIVPYPGTALFKTQAEAGNLLTMDWDRFDMRSPVMRSPLTEREIRACIARTYRGFLHPMALLRQLFRMLKHPAYLFKGAAALAGHLRDFVHTSSKR